VIAHRRVGDVLGDVVGELEDVFSDLDVLAARFRALATAELGRDDLVPLRQTIFEMLDRHRLVAGAGVITTPDLLCDAPRWLEWWWINSGGSPEALRVNLDPTAPDFYDYTTADWYATPERTLARHVAGPYVDYLCTNEYTITLSTPVVTDAAMIGVAAADVLLSSLEHRVLPVLARLPDPVVLANADGRVIASNSAYWAPGVRSPAAPATGLAPDPRSPLRSWILIGVFEP
jgi:hypothetical protein